MAKVTEMAPYRERKERERLWKLRDMNACSYTKPARDGCSKRVETCIRYRVGTKT